MSWTQARSARGVPDRVRVKADTGSTDSIMHDMRSLTMTATYDFIHKLDDMGFGDRFDATVRGLMTVGYSVPIKILCIGLYPYEQDILPPIATSLAYSPIKCSGVTPSVQVLSQAMAMVMRVKSNRSKTKSTVGTVDRRVAESGFVAKYAEMLRCSYMCSVVGVSFINCVVVPSNNIAKKVRCASLFSEWLGRVIEIHDKFGFKMNIVAMGEMAADSVRNTFSAFRGTNRKVSYVGTSNPAMISYMNINKYNSICPLDDSITSTEAAVYKMMSVDDYTIPNVEYQWKTYPSDVLYEIMTDQSIGSLARALAAHTVEELLVPFEIMSRNLFSNISTKPIGYTPGAIPDTDDNRSVVTESAAINTGVFANQHTGPSSKPSIFADNSGADQGVQYGQDGGGGGGDHQQSFNQTAQDRNFYVNRSSIIAQMNDVTGKSKSQQVIVLENMLSKLENILELFRTREVTIMKMADAVESIASANSVEDDELDEILTVVKERYPEQMRELEEAVAVVGAMPALIEGDTGVIEGMIQPSAPLMRRYDGTTMRDNVYEQMMTDRSDGTAQMRNPRESMGAFATTTTGHNHSTMQAATGSGTSLPHPGADPDQLVSSEIKEAMFEIFLDALGTYGSDGVLDVVDMDVVDVAGTQRTMMDIVTTAMGMYVTAKGGDASCITDDMLESIVSFMEPPTTNRMVEVGTMMWDNLSSEEMVVELFEDILA
ncbi:benzoate 4-monooxygenase cytochrome P450 [Fusarium albosuccineum]|uniref:Benzoate 4-monooxygenase cytochrome P450 n=1 Tax=Fusarium albosuccineum TaxID=1237068 RepID=A0A8H4KZJ8_9HYPO|nr:benzoate 4-monooxygenase cytochrome P450 [Fusarium albosuccineum]